MNVDQILSHVRQKGILLVPNGHRIKYKAPNGAMTPGLAATIKSHKKEILRVLSREPDAFLPDACPITTGVYSPGVMHHCRFTKKVLRDLITEKALPLDTGCPLINSCGLVCP